MLSHKPLFLGVLLIGAQCLGSLVHARTLTLTGTVTHVSDGDTLWVQTAQHGKPRKVRLLGLDAPESCQAWGPQASAALAALVLRRTVQLESRAHDSYDRTLATVSVGGQDVGRWLVAQGHAWSYSYRRKAGPYAAEQAQAQMSRSGLWGQAALEPRLFRKQHGACPH
jgi:micrococcal nuclease